MSAELTNVADLAVLDGSKMHERIYVQLRRAIMAGRYLPGEALTLRALAGILGTSIIPVRDAVLRLVAEQALVKVGRNIRIPDMTLDQFRDVLRLREALEGEAAAIAAERASAQDLKAIRAANAALLTMQQKGALQGFLDANQTFHFSVYAAAHNALLQSMIETLWLQIGPHLGLLLRRSEGNDTRHIDLSAHDRLIAAIATRDAPAARAALIADLEDSTDIFRPWTQVPAARRAGRRLS